MDSTETNLEAAINLLRSRGIEAVSGFVFEMPDGLKVRVSIENDPFLDKPFESGTKITIFTSAKAGVIIKVGGDCWLLHQNDADPWPSDFHAHNGREVLDCHTGNIFNKTTRKLVRKYRPKQLAQFVAEVPDRLRK